MTSLKKINLCLSVGLCRVVLLGIEDFVLKIGNVIVKVVMKTVMCIYFSAVVSPSVRFERPSAVLAACF